MSWILKHWDQEYINKAETSIWKTVSLFGFYGFAQLFNTLVR
jgi:hypothetical protein